jgi:AcrR family transcriptional regulator
MGRPARHARSTILDCAKHVSAEVGPQKLTIAAVAKRAGAPIGSIYHRYASRHEILAAVWLDLVEEFQGRFLAALEGSDPVAAAAAAVRYTCRWVRRHPREARLMLLHRREDFAAEGWPQSYRGRAEKLAGQAGERLQRYAARLLGRRRSQDLRIVRFIVVDLPTAALKRDIETGTSPSKGLEVFLLDTCTDALRRARVRRTKE